MAWKFLDMIPSLFSWNPFWMRELGAKNCRKARKLHKTTTETAPDALSALIWAWTVRVTREAGPIVASCPEYQSIQNIRKASQPITWAEEPALWALLAAQKFQKGFYIPKYSVY